MKRRKDRYRKERNRAKRLSKYILDGGRELSEVFKIWKIETWPSWVDEYGCKDEEVNNA